MPKNPNDDLLDNAIPIDELEIIEDDSEPLLQGAIPIDQMEVGDAPSTTADPLTRGPTAVEEIELADEDDNEGGKQEIITFDKGRADEDAKKWNRTPDPEGTSAIRCRSFVAKLRLDAIEHMDEQINEWLDAHPQYTIKHITSTIGVLKGKEREDALFLSVFV